MASASTPSHVLARASQLLPIYIPSRSEYQRNQLLFVTDDINPHLEQVIRGRADRP